MRGAKEGWLSAALRLDKSQSSTFGYHLDHEDIVNFGASLVKVCCVAARGHRCQLNASDTQGAQVYHASKRAACCVIACMHVHVSHMGKQASQTDDTRMLVLGYRR